MARFVSLRRVKFSTDPIDVEGLELRFCRRRLHVTERIEIGEVRRFISRKACSIAFRFLWGII
jgi:hypothetical protein